MSRRARTRSLLALALSFILASTAFLVPATSASQATITGEVATGGGLLVSAASDRSSPLVLAGANTSEGDLHVFWARSSDPSDDSGVRYVDFFLDGKRKREWIAPFDAAGTARNGSALPLTGLSTGSHTIRVEVVRWDKTVSKTSATFTVGQQATTTTTAPAPADAFLVSASADRSSAVPIDGWVATGTDAHLFWARHGDPNSSSGVSHVEFSLDGVHVRREALAPYDLAGTNGGTAFPLAVADLAPGTHVAAAKVTFSDGSTRTESASFQVPATDTEEAPVTSTDEAPATSTEEAPVTSTEEAPASGGGEVTTEPSLSWAPPVLTSPTTINVSTQPYTITLEAGKDYRIEMPSSPVTKAMTIRGGRNVVLVGGEIAIPWQGTSPTASQRRGLLIRDQTGTVHIEGLLIHGDDVSEGIQIAAPQARVQLQNIRVMNVHARDQVNFSDNHPDIVQPWGGVSELLIDRLTGETDYQGLFLPEDLGAIGKIDLRRVNILGTSTSRYLLWASTGYPLSVHEVYARPAEGRSWDLTVWKSSEWSNAKSGVPADGDFVKDGQAGIGYVSPGYVG